MKNRIRRIIAVLLAVVMVLCAVPAAGFSGLDLSGVADWFSTTARAESDGLTEGYYTYTVENGGATITDCNNNISGDVVIPDTLGGYPVTSIDEYAFSDCRRLVSVTIPDSITRIGIEAFYGCTGLTSITVSPGNKVYHSENNCIIDTEEKELVLGCKNSVIPSDGSVTSIGECAFEDCTGLTSITIPDSVTNIGNYAFSYCADLTSVTIPDGVIRIGESAFEHCTGLSSVTIPDGVIRIGESAFEYCTGLTGITIPNSVTIIGYSAFSRCTGLTSITVSPGNKVYHSENNCIIHTEAKELVVGCKSSVIPSDGSVTSIGSWTFYDCTGLTSITIPDSVTIIGYSAFSHCTGLTSITIPDSVTSIGDSAFSGCTGLTSLTIPNSVTSIGDSAFSGCTGLTSITIPNCVTSIGYSAFSGCTGLTSITIPNSVTSIGSWTFSGCTGLESVIIGNGVTSIGGSAFEDCTGLTSITIPDSVISIGEYAFRDCTGLTSITIPDSVISIGLWAFSGTDWYNSQPDGDVYAGKVYYEYKGEMLENTSIEIEAGTKGIADYAFSGCTGLTSITIPDSVTSIGDSVFEGCTGLTSITIPDSVISIGGGAFYDCTDLTSIAIPDSVTSIGGSAFYGTTWYGSQSNGDVYAGKVYYGYIGEMPENTSIEIKAGTKGIADSAFSYCSGLASITIPDSVTSIGDGAFYDCTGLTSIAIPDSVTSIGTEVFFGCTGLKSVIIGNGVTYMGESVFDGCTGLTDLVIGNGITSIESNAFLNLPNLTNVTIGSSVESIGDFAFCGRTSLKSITIPDSVTSIGDGAFANCIGLADIEISKNIADIGYGAFADCINLKAVKLPKSVKTIGEYAFGYYEENNAVAKVPGFVIHGYAGTAAETYANKNGFTFISLGGEHTHTFSDWTVTREPTCTAEGEETKTCAGCGATETRKVEKKEHSLTHVEKGSTCKIQGVSYDVCDMCENTFNYTVLPLAPHTFGEWTVTKEVTAFESGERVRTCSVCGFEEKEKIEKLPVSEIKDEKTGITIIIPDADSKDVELNVVPVTSGEVSDALNSEKSNFKKSLFDITTTIDGEAVQPDGTVLVKIPLPEGYNPEKTVVYHVSDDGKLEKLESSVADGYVVFETTHFSYYAIVDETEQKEPEQPPKPENPSNNCSCICHKGGISAFFYKIARFFWKLFKTHKYCSCGVAHY